jgi:cytochrome d ubiquinol oxidase subunit II
MDGYAVDPATGTLSMEAGKYLNNLISMPIVAILLVSGLLLVIYGVAATSFMKKDNGIWFGGIGTVFTGLSIFFLAAFNNTAFYPSKADLQSSLTIYNASSSHYTLTAMTYVAFMIPFVLGYIAYVWYLMDAKKLGESDISGEHEAY